MSDTESIAAASAAHPTLGGKSVQVLERPRYKSWRKKYRKMRHTFDARLEDNKRLFKDERKLEGIAKRLREELGGLLDLCLDLNQNPNISPELRFDVSHALLPPRMQSVVPENITPEEANELLHSYTAAVHSGQIPHLDLHVVREQIEARLAAKDVVALSALEGRVPHATVPTTDALPEELKVDEPLSFLTAEQESDYILRVDARLGDQFSLTKASEKEASTEEKPWTELTTREQERVAERLNPQSQHNWLKQNTKLQAPTGEALDEMESPMAPERAERTETTPKTGGGKKRAAKNLAKQIGGRAVERARENWSPSNLSGFEDDDISVVDFPAPGKKRVKDPDGAYRAKGGKGGSGKGKRKRSGEDGAIGGADASTSSKKAKLENLMD